jgi:hypothetical protein
MLAWQAYALAMSAPGIPAYFLFGLIVVAIVVFRLAAPNRIGGEPRRFGLWRRRAVPTSAPSETPTDPFADDPRLATDPNLAGVKSEVSVMVNLSNLL